MIEELVKAFEKEFGYQGDQTAASIRRREFVRAAEIAMEVIGKELDLVTRERDEALDLIDRLEDDMPVNIREMYSDLD